jgi:hypothetical protein
MVMTEGQVENDVNSKIRTSWGLMGEAGKKEDQEKNVVF